jgi:Uma2 family endonuclease
MTAAVRMLDDDDIRLTRAGVRFPIELRPEHFRPDDPSTWPEGDGRLEYVDGRLLFMPPCADIQQYVVADAVYILRQWAASHSDFLVGGNEAGMKLGADIRAADAAIWRRSEVGPARGRLQHVPPLLAVEVAGTDEDEEQLRTKARWYLAHGVKAVWIVLPEAREVLVLLTGGEQRLGGDAQIAEIGELPGLCPPVSALFSQL